MNETSVVNQMVKTLKRHHPSAWCMKVHGNAYQSSGIPDLIFVVNGVTFGVEVKHQKPGESREHALGRVSKLQHYQLQQLAAAGAVTGIALTPDELMEIVDDGLNRG